MPQLSKDELIALVETFAGRLSRLEKEQQDYVQKMKREPRKEWTETKEVPRTHIEIPPGMDLGTRRMTITHKYTPDEIKRARAAIEVENKQLQPGLDEITSKIRRIKVKRPYSELNAEVGYAEHVLTENEVELIGKALTNSTVQLREYLGPRAIRAFLFRYQLARIIFKQLEIHWPPEVLVRLLVDGILAVKTNGTPQQPQLTDRNSAFPQRAIRHQLSGS